MLPKFDPSAMTLNMPVKGFRVLFRVILFAFVIIGLYGFTALGSMEDKPPITIYLAGDSTVQTYAESRFPQMGWGQVLGAFFNDAIAIKNHAAGGRSSKSFINEGRLDNILNEIRAGDYLFIQFAHNDEKFEDPGRYTAPFTTYKSYLKQYIDGAREKGAYPVLVTPVHRRGFDSNDKIKFTHDLYPSAMLQLGAETDVPVIDLHLKSQLLFEQLGEAGTKDVFLWLEPGEYESFPEGSRDNSHFTQFGAEQVARLVVEGMIELGLPLENFVTEYKGRVEPEKSRATAVQRQVLQDVATPRLVVPETDQMLFFEDFTNDDVGALPVGWTIESPPGHVEVIEDGRLESKRAVRLITHPTEKTTRLTTRFKRSPSVNTSTIAIEHFILNENGLSGGINMYIMKNANNVNWYVDPQGRLGYRSDKGTAVVGKLDDGWNRIRLIADRDRNEVYVYLNDMDRPAAGPLAFRVPIDSWNGASIRIQHTETSNPPDIPVQFLYGEFKVWEVEEQLTADLTPVRTSFWVGDTPLRTIITPFPTVSSKVSKEHFRLIVKETMGIDRHTQPISSGVPFPNGELSKPSDVRLLNAHAEEIPLQTTVLSQWPDGSIRWLLLDFQMDLLADEEVELYVQYGSDVAQSVRDDGITAEDDDDLITVSTGTLDVTFGKTAPLIRRLRVGGIDWDNIGDPELVIVGEHGLQISNLDGPYQLMIEESGSERTVIRVISELHEKASHEVLNFAYDIRFHFYRDGSVVRIDPVVTNLAGVHVTRLEKTNISSVSMRFPGWSSPGVVNYVAGAGPDDADMSGRASTFRLLQTSSNTFDILSDKQIVATGSRSPGWVSFFGDERYVGIGIRHFWQQSPKAIDRNDQGDLTVYLWGPGSHPDVNLLGMGGGEGKRHEIYFSLANNASAESIQGLLYPLRAVASPAWYSSTKAFGRSLFVVDKDELPLYDPVASLYEDYVDTGYATIMQFRERYDEYGWRDFGDWSTSWDPDGWGNSEYDMAYAFFQQFARTGNLDFFDLAETAARHWMDVDFIWATNDFDWLGGALMHSTDHRSHTGEHHTWNEGMIHNYWLTGDRRSLEASIAVGDFFAHLALDPPNRHRPRLFQNPERDVGTRSAAWALMSLMAIYEATLDHYYLEAATQIVDVLEIEQEEDGQWPYLIAANEIESRPIATKPFMTALVIRSLGDYYRVTNDEKAAHMLVKGLRYLVDALWNETTKGYPYIDHPTQFASPSNTGALLLDGFAYAYEITNDPEWLRVGLTGFDASMRTLIGSVQNRHVGKAVPQTLRHTAHSLAVFLEPSAYAIEGPMRFVVGRQKRTQELLTLTRRDLTEGIAGTLHVKNLPDGLTVNTSALNYVFQPGERTVKIPVKVEIDNHVAPGWYNVTFTDDQKDGLSLTLPVEVPGWSQVDRFAPPVSDSFFGNFTFQMAESISDGWEHDGRNPELFFSNTQRLRPVGSKEEYLIYDAPGLFDFTIVLYATLSSIKNVEELIDVMVSFDGGKWEAIDTKVIWETQEGGQYARGTMSPEDAFFRGDVKLKVTIYPTDGEHVVQLGRLDMRGWK